LKKVFTGKGNSVIGTTISLDMMAMRESRVISAAAKPLNGATRVCMSPS